MKRLAAVPSIIFLVISCLMIGCSPIPESRPDFQAPPNTWETKVVGVVSGDTIMVRGHAGAEKVKLYGVFSPDEGQPFHLESLEFATKMTLGKSVYIAPVTTGTHRVEIAVVYVGSLCLNAELIKSGLAWYYERRLRQKAWKTLSESAKYRHKGIWSEIYPNPPRKIVEDILHLVMMKNRYKDKIVDLSPRSDRIEQGMSQEEVARICGQPEDTTQFTYQHLTYSRWICSGLYVYFENGKVIKVEAFDAELK